MNFFFFNLEKSVTFKESLVCASALTRKIIWACRYFGGEAAFVKYYEVFCSLQRRSWNQLLQLGVTLYKITEENLFSSSLRFDLKLFGKCCASGDTHCVGQSISILFSSCKLFSLIFVRAWTLHLLNFVLVYFHLNGASCRKLYAGNTTWTWTKRSTEWG